MNARYGERTVADGEADALVDPARMSPAASTPGSVVSSGHGSRCLSGQRPDRDRIDAGQDVTEVVARDRARAAIGAAARRR